MDVILEIGKTVNTVFFYYFMLRPAEVYELCIP